MKFAKFHPKARDAIREFPEDVRRGLGKAIFDLQKGEKLSMPLSRTMTSVATGVEELRLKDVLESIEFSITRDWWTPF